MEELQEVKIVAVEGVINFPDFENLKKQATELAEFVSSVEVNEDTINSSKKLLAKVNKSIKALNDRRISIKKQMLKPYDTFAEQIKEIESIVKGADTEVRNKVRELEERERENKKAELKKIWHLRIDSYHFAKMFHFEEWLKNEHLNKSLSLKKTEEQMTNWLEEKEKDLKVLSEMENAKSLLAEYKEVEDVALAISIVNERNKREEEKSEFVQEVKQDEFIFKVFGEKDKRLVQLLMENNNIKYKEI